MTSDPANGGDLSAWLAKHGDANAQAVAARYSSLVRMVGEESFGGTYWREGDLVVLVVEGADTTRSRQIEQWSAHFPLVEVETVEAAHSLKTLEAIGDEAYSVVEELAPGQLETIAVSVEQNAVQITVLPDVHAAVSSALRDRYGTAVTVVSSTREELPERLNNRGLDFSPYIGGSRTRWYPTANYGYDATCTSSYAWREWGTGRIVETTAAHCYAVGQRVYNAQTTMGVVERKAGPAGATDAEVIAPLAGSSVTYAPRIWVGGPLTTTSWPVVGAIEETTAYIGSPIVISGANNGETRGTVTSINARVCFVDGCTEGLTGIRVTSNGVRGGDSGAPCFSSKGGAPATVMARGQLVGPAAGVGSVTYCTPVFDVSAALGISILTQ